MAKKRAREADGTSGADKMAVDGAESSDDEDFDMVNVEFEWFNFDADIDFHGTKALLRQLLDVDAALHDISGLADLVLSQPTIGSTIKVDGKETDPYAMLTALNLKEHASGDKKNKGMEALVKYLADKAGSSTIVEGAGKKSTAKPLASVVPELLQSQLDGGAEATVGLILSERLINMPPEISPPMYRMVIDEIEAAVEDKEPYEFSHYLILSKTYQEVESSLPAEDMIIEEEAGARKGKKRGKKDTSAAGGDQTWFFHPEDEVLQRFATSYGSYNFTKHDDNVADSKRAFQEMGIRPQGHMILIERSRFQEAVDAVGEYLKAPGQ